MHQLELKSYLKRSVQFGKECLIKTEGDHPTVADHLLVRMRLGGGRQQRGDLTSDPHIPGEHSARYTPGQTHAFPVLLELLNCVQLINIH